MADLLALPPLPLSDRTRTSILAAMIDRLAAQDMAPLARLVTRDPSDPALALLDGWATIGDVLDFYTARIAVEGYLPTATERRSLIELARLVGYRPRPGLAASAWLAYDVTPDPADAEVTVPAGAKVQSVPDPSLTVPAPAAVPQIFETSQDLAARQAWNLLPGVASRPMPLDTLDARCRTVMYAQGGGLGLGANDRLLVRFRATGSGDTLSAEGAVAVAVPAARVRVVASVAEDAAAQRAVLTLAPGNCAGEAAAGVVFAGWDVLRVKAAPFGAAAPLHVLPLQLGVDEGPAAGDPVEWSLDPALYDTGTRTGRRTVLPLDAEYPRIIPGSWVVVERPGYATRVVRVRSVDTRGLTAYGISGRVTRLVLDGPWIGPFDTDATLAALREISVFAQSEPLTPADEPLTAAVAGDEVDVAADVTDLPSGRMLIVTGAPAADAEPGQAPGEVVPLLGTQRHAGGGPGGAPYTSLLLATPLIGRYDPATVVVRANAVHATNGETKDEPAIGSGDATAANQEFALHQKPLTYVASDDADGAQAELTVRVGGVTWHEVAEIVRTGPDEHAYQVMIADTGDVTMRFGDGVHGARLPTGQANVSAHYRVGLGTAGNLGAGRLSQALTRPLGVTSVTNPLPSAGGTDPDDDEAIRSRAALGVLAMDRIVGLVDYANFSLARSGVGAAAAYRIATAGRELVQITVSGVAGAALTADSDVVVQLARAARRFGDPGIDVEVAPCGELQLVVEAGLEIGADRTWALMLPQLLSALDRRLGPVARPIGRGCFPAEVVAALQAVPGVVSVHLTRFGATTGTSPADAAAVTTVLDYAPAAGARPRTGPVNADQDARLADPAQRLALRTALPGFAVLNQVLPRKGTS